MHFIKFWYFFNKNITLKKVSDLHFQALSLQKSKKMEGIPCCSTKAVSASSVHVEGKTEDLGTRVISRLREKEAEDNTRENQ